MSVVKQRGKALDQVALYQSLAAYCAYLLRRDVEPRRRALIERERQDWLLLADEHGLWRQAARPATSGLNPL